MINKQIEIQNRKNLFASENDFKHDNIYIEIKDIIDNEIIGFTTWRHSGSITYNFRSGWSTQPIKRNISNYLREVLEEKKRVLIFNFSEKLGLEDINSHNDSSLNLMEELGLEVVNLNQELLSISYLKDSRVKTISLYTLCLLQFKYKDLETISNLIDKYSF